MKPLKLTMQAFSTYLNMVTIDFTALNEKGLYLISGDTGAGKTTIFDAICYALYGETSGQRSSDIFRSNFAPYQMPTIVELEFLLHGRNYLVHREFSLRESGKKRPDIDYFKNGEEIVTGKLNVNHEIVRIMGVDATQFKQIVMIAQGEFTKLLHASSRDRVLIFRDIFHTSVYMDFEKTIDRLTKGYESRYQESMMTLNTLLTNMKIDVGDQYHHETLSLIKTELERLKAEKEIHEKAIASRNEKARQMTSEYYALETANQMIDQYEGYLNERELLKKQEDDYQQSAMLIERIKKAGMIAQDEEKMLALIRQLVKLEATEDELKKRSEELTTQVADYKKRSSDIPQLTLQNEALQNEIISANAKLAQKKAYEHEQELLRDLSSKKASLEARLTQDEASRDKLKKRMERDENSIASIPEIQIEMNKLDDKMEKLIKKRNMLHQFADLYDAYYQEQEKQYEMTHIHHQLSRRHQEMYLRYCHEYDRYLNDQAGFLAEHLLEGQPCPVCGSLHHPQLATINQETMTIAQLDELLKETDSLKAQVDQADIQLRAQMLKKHGIFEQVNLLKRELDIQVEEIQNTKQIFVAMLAEVVHQEDEDRKMFGKLQGELEYLQRLSVSLKNDKRTFERLEDKIKRTRDEVNQIRASISHQMGIISTMDVEGFMAISEETIHELHQKQENIKQALEALKTEKENLDRMSTILETQINDNRIQLEQKRLEVLEAKDIFESKVQHAFASKVEYATYRDQLLSVEEKEQAFNRYMQRCASLDQLISDFQNRIKDQKKVDLTSYRAALDAYQNEKQALDHDSYEAIHLYDDVNRIYRKMKKLAKDNAELFETYERYHHLDQITNGKNNFKLSFERYVLASYFEQILTFANVELEKLTQGRFRFLRRKEVRGNAGQGLDLNILDFETGISRDVKSLSGGESFKASLALALGLSEMIQSYAGGIELNALFIDEGFGSLDDESLDQAINVLLDMKSNDKVISIISHVSELKNRIDTGIVVTRGVQGSSMKIMH